MSIDKAIENAVKSVEMEGFAVDDKCKVWCRKLMHKEITMEEYIALVKNLAGVVA